LVKNSADSLLEIINDILDISKIEAGKIDLEHRTFNLRELINIILRTLQFKANENSLYLKEEIDSTIPNYLIGDALRMKQIIINLVNNAIKFTHVGGVTIKLSSVRNTPGSIWFKVEVIDTGIGIPKDKQASIFEKFTQADASTTRQYGGTGLGLSISKQLIEMMGGSLQLESEPNVGSSFFFEIELEIASAQQIEILKKEEQEQAELLTGATFSSNLKILIAEDNLTNQKYIQSLLKIYNLSPTIVNNGQEAIDALETDNYHVILMDMHMPVLNGIDATIHIRKSNTERIKNIPIIALTAAAYKEDEDKMLAAGMNDFISKPINEEKLLRALQHINESLPEDVRVVHRSETTIQEETPAVAEPVSQPSITIPVSESMIVIHDFNANFGTFSKEILTEIIDDFIGAYEQKMTRIKTHIENKDFRKLMLDAHSLKGEVAMFCADPVKEKLYTLEDKGRKEVADNLSNDFDIALIYLHALSKQLETIKQAR